MNTICDSLMIVMILNFLALIGLTVATLLVYKKVNEISPELWDDEEIEQEIKNRLFENPLKN